MLRIRIGTQFEFVLTAGPDISGPYRRKIEIQDSFRQGGGFMARQEAVRRGDLNERFRLFYLKDTATGRVDWHYHNFHKILFFLGGHASYVIEGKRYALEPGDMVLVPQGCIHRPEVQSDLPYERYVLYLSQSFLDGASSDETDLAACFRMAEQRYQFVLRPDREGDLFKLLGELRQAQDSPQFGRDLMCRAWLTQILVTLTRKLEDHQLLYVSSVCDEKIVSVLRYLNLHVGEPLSIDDLARQFYISKYYLMRRFKAATGHSIHGYISEKRLILARSRIAAGEPLKQVSESCGFRDYSAFARAYKQRFGISPSTPLPPQLAQSPDREAD